jgi:N-acetylglucosaminyldiphosphoundecaprenol N-acetyl-beta-D-mannosaminyltransferase
MRRLGAEGQDRIDGPGLMWRLCATAARDGRSVYLYGGREETLALLTARLLEAHPGLEIAGAESPPFRAATREEDAATVRRIAASGASIVFVSLGCPKQELWMHEHRDRIDAVVAGVGAAFDYHAGTLRRAPVWMQKRGLEWAFRLSMEPRRLWKRYLVTNTWFLVLATRQLAGHWLRPGRAS